MYRSACLIFALLSLLGSAISQNGNNLWYFGNNAGLDFSLGYPVAVLDGALVTADNTATVSDPITGELLFYSNGVEVWNRNHDVMPNGQGLLGNWSGGTSAIAVKLPGNNQIYYLFTTDAFAWPNGLRYSIIDLELDNGLGDVTDQKNIVVHEISTEKLAITKHADGVNYWIVTHPWNSDEYHVYRFNEQGLSQSPVVSKIGLFHGGDSYNAMGQIAFSQDGLRLASAVYFTHYELFRFDPTNGQLSDQKILNGHLNAWGVQFSQNNDFLYATKWKNDEIIQFDLTSDDEDLINKSMTIIGNATGPNSLYKAGYLQTGPDNRIYVAKFDSDFIGVIESPNSKGLESNYIDNGVHLGGRTCQAGLSNQFISQSPFDILSVFFTYTIIDDSIATFTGFSNDPDTWSWFLGDDAFSSQQNPSYTFPSSGKYHVCLTVTKGSLSAEYCDTVIICFSPKADFEYVSAQNNFTFLNNSVDAVAYLWDFGDGYFSYNENANHQYGQSGEYRVVLIAKNECSSDTLERLLYVPPFENDSINRTPPIYVIYPNPNNGNFSVKVFESHEVIFKLYSSDGKLVFQDERLFNAFEETKYSMHLMSGNYTVRLIINGRLHEQKLIILND